MTFVDLSGLPPIDTQRGGSPDLLRLELMDVITDAIASHPRSLQTRIGPSEIGIDCNKCLARKLAGLPENDMQGPAWIPTVGTSVHAWLQEQFILANAGLPTVRWLLESSVDVGDIDGQAITGHADLYDRVTATVVDWKVCGAASLKRYKAVGPGQQYRVQAHLYGRGFVRRGLPVDTVAVCFLPQNAALSEAVWWAEPYDEQIAVDALARASTIAGLIDAAGVDAVVARLPAADGCYSCGRYWPPPQATATEADGTSDPAAA